jgi:hypothetical protein
MDGQECIEAVHEFEGVNPTGMPYIVINTEPIPIKIFEKSAYMNISITRD